MSNTGVLRALDLAMALLLLTLLVPLWLLRALLALIGTSRIFDGVELVGLHRRPFTRWAFAGPLPGRDLAALFNILRGDLAFAGPRSLTPAEAATVPVEANIRFRVRPGLFSPYQLHCRTGIAHDPEFRVDEDFIERLSVRSSLGLVVRSLIAGLLGGGERPTPPMLDFFGVPITNTTMDEAVAWIAERASPVAGSNHPGAARHPSLSKEGNSEGQAPANVAQGDGKSLLAFVNPDCLNIAYTNSRYRQVLQQAARVLPDGIGLKIGCRMRGLGLAANVNGTDLFPRLCERAAREGWSLFLLGAQPDVAEEYADPLSRIAHCGRSARLFHPGRRSRDYCPDQCFRGASVVGGFWRSPSGVVAGGASGGIDAASADGRRRTV